MEPELRPCLREQAIEIYRSTILQAAELGAESLRRVKRQLAQCDLFFLLTHVLGRADLNRDWYFARCTARCREIRTGISICGPVSMESLQ